MLRLGSQRGRRPSLRVSVLMAGSVVVRLVESGSSDWAVVVALVGFGVSAQQPRGWQRAAK